MSKKYTRGIVSPKGFDMSAAEPVDQREIVEYQSDLLSFTHAYLGMEVKVIELDYDEYKLIALPSTLLSNWVQISNSGDTGPEGPVGAPGSDGESAYAAYVANGGTLTEEEWLASLEGQPGPVGQTGPQGVRGLQGVEGVAGPAGVQGPAGGGVSMQGSDTIANILSYDPTTPALMWISLDAGIDSYTNPVAAGDGLVSDGINWLTVGPIRGPQGETGLTGDKGDQGDQGIPGTSGDSNYIYVQGSPATLWGIEHGLNKYPSVTILDTAGYRVRASVEHYDLNNVIIRFNKPFAGSATFN
jgi:hypothetical protein